MGCGNYYPAEDMIRLGIESVCGDECIQVVRDRRGRKKVSGPRVTSPPKTDKSRIPSALRKEIHRRDGEVCRRCGKKAYRMEVHHALYRSQGGPDVRHNLILLCEECHQWAHSNKKRNQPVLLAALWFDYVEGEHLMIPDVERIVRKLAPK